MNNWYLCHFDLFDRIILCEDCIRMFIDNAPKINERAKVMNKGGLWIKGVLSKEDFSNGNDYMCGGVCGRDVDPGMVPKRKNVHRDVMKELREQIVNAFGGRGDNEEQEEGIDDDIVSDVATFWDQAHEWDHASDYVCSNGVDVKTREEHEKVGVVVVTMTNGDIVWYTTDERDQVPF